MRAIKAFFFVFFLIVLIVLLFENFSALSQPLTLKANFLLIRLNIPEYPVGAYLLFSFILGFLLAGLFGLVSRFRMGAKLREQEKRIREMGKISSEARDTKLIEE